MKSNSAAPDFVWMSRCELGDRCLTALDQLGDDGRIGLDRSRRAAEQGPGGALVGQRPDEAVAVEDGLQRVPGQRIGSPRDSRSRRGRRRGQPSGDVDEQAAAGLAHRRGGRHLPEGQPEGLHRVGHHLLMTDGEVDVGLPVARSGIGYRVVIGRLCTMKPRRRRRKAPLDVLRAAEVRFDPPAESLEPHDLRIRQRRVVLQLGLDRAFGRPARRRRGGSPASSCRPACRRPRRLAPCIRPGSRGRRPVPRRGRSWPRPRRPCGWT